jgi:hypothetical protein
VHSAIRVDRGHEHRGQTTSLCPMNDDQLRTDANIRYALAGD